MPKEVRASAQMLAGAWGEGGGDVCVQNPRVTGTREQRFRSEGLT